MILRLEDLDYNLASYTLLRVGEFETGSLYVVLAVLELAM